MLPWEITHYITNRGDNLQCIQKYFINVFFKYIQKYFINVFFKCIQQYYINVFVKCIQKYFKCIQIYFRSIKKYYAACIQKYILNVKLHQVLEQITITIAHTNIECL